jgi:two-component system sensor histidine kinase UhpB
MTDPRPPAAPLDLPGLLMRRAGLLALAVLLLALLLGLLRMADDIDDEVDGALQLADMLARLQTLPTLDDGAALAQLAALGRGDAPRHLRLQVADAQGRPLLVSAAAPSQGWLLDALLALHRRVRPGDEGRSVAWTLARPAGGPWTVSLHASTESERAEAMRGLLAGLLLLALAAGGLLLVMRWNLRHALAPLQRLLAAIGSIERRDTQLVAALPTMPVRELEVVAQALRHLAQALDEAEAQRRALGQRVLTLQEDERARLARELHDEFGQQLTALRVDAAWLQRQLAQQPAALAVLQSLAGHARHIQQQLRQVLARLRPLPEGPGQTVPATQLAELLQSLADGWSAAPPPAPQVQLQLTGLDDAPALPAALALALYRITQEALTNAARHAGASQVSVQLQRQGNTLRWQVADDGAGLADPGPALLRGSGLAGLRERVWALGGELRIDATRPGAARPGLTLSAQLALDQ